MRISVKKITVKHYKFKLKNPIKLQSGQVITYREGLLLYYPINQHYHIADVAPLPGFSTETIQEVQKEITTNMPKSPSLKCGLEALKLMNQSHKKNIPLDLIIAQKLNLTTQKEKNNTPITYNGLVTLNTTQIESKIKQLYQKGIHTIKIKVGYTYFEKELPILKKLIEKFDKKITFRIDPNQQWTAKKIKTFCSLVPTENIEYIEDPVQTITELQNCSPYFNKIAIDQLLPEININDPLLQKIQFIVYKPTLMGGIKKLIQIKKNAPQNQKIIISHTFESAIGLYYLHYIAHHLNHNYAHGLYYNYF